MIPQPKKQKGGTRNEGRKVHDVTAQEKLTLSWVALGSLELL